MRRETRRIVPLRVSFFVFRSRRTYANRNVPDHREIYILAIGVLAGILLGPQVFGRLAPDAYQQWFRSVEQVQDELATYRRELTESATDLSLEEFRERHEDRLTQLRDQLQQAYRVRARLTYVVLMLVGVCVAEVIVAGRNDVARRLARLRYILLAIGAAIVLSQPYILMSTPLVFVGIIALVCIVAFFIGNKPNAAEPTTEAEA